MKLNKKDQSRLTGYQNEARSTPQYSDAEIQSALKQVAGTTQGVGLTRTTYQSYYEANRGEVPHPFTIIRRYGTWNHGLQAAGLPVNQRRVYSRPFAEERCLDGIRLARKYLGHLPSVLEYNRIWNHGHGKHSSLKDQGYPSEATIRARFGKWRTALAQAVAEENGK